MKKLITLMLCTTLFAGMANAKTIFVAGSGNNTDGLTWANAKKSIEEANAIAGANDVIYVKSGLYDLTSSSNGIAALATKSNVSYYGGFAGLSEAETPATRIVSDLDANGIVDPFEFTNPSILFFTLTNNAIGLNVTTNSTTQSFDGFKIQGTHECGTVDVPLINAPGNIANSIVLINNFVLFKNNTISECTATSYVNSTNSAYGANKGTILAMNGYASAVDNCIFENISSSIFAGNAQSDTQGSPFIHIIASGSIGRNLFSNSIIRKNEVLVDYTEASASLGTIFNTRGLLISMTAPQALTHTVYNAIKNVVVYNNSVVFTPQAALATPLKLGNCGLIYVYKSATTIADSILNCTIANNKSTRIGFALAPEFSNNTQPYRVIANNVVYNNTNQLASGSVTLQNISINIAMLTSGTSALVANNITNGGATAFSNSTSNGVSVVNNLSDLSTTNTNPTNGAYFTSPSTVIGYSFDASVDVSNWTIGANSYLRGKGLKTTTLTDKTGYPFATPPSVGAYEFRVNAGFGNVNYSVSNLATVSGRDLLLKTEGAVEVYNTLGRLVGSRNADETTISLINGGVYFIKAQTTQGIKVQKVLVK